jgi:hypothetical protein
MSFIISFLIKNFFEKKFKSLYYNKLDTYSVNKVSVNYLYLLIKEKNSTE